MGELATLRRASRAVLCVECGKCSTLCPLAPFGGFSAARMMAIHSPEEEAPDLRAVELCLTCGACEVRCPQGVRFTEFVRGLREHLAESHRQPCPHGGLLRSAARMTAGEHPPARDLSWVTPDLQVAQSGEVALFVGCLPFFDALFSRQLGIDVLALARAAVRLLNHLGITPVLAADERCCGHDLLWSGEVETFRALARANAAAMAARGVKRIITACAECCRTWRLDYAEAAPGFHPRVQHLSELLAEAAAEGKLTLSPDGPGPVTYQDPCRLGRHLGVTDPPRQLIEALGTELVEMERSREDALCCGTSGFNHCDANSRELQARRLAEAAATGAGKLLTSCPKCLIHFACAQAEDRLRKRESPAIELEDLFVYTAKHLASPATSAASALASRAAAPGGSA